LGKINVDTIGLLGFALNINGLRPFHFLLFGKGLCYDPEGRELHKKSNAGLRPLHFSLFEDYAMIPNRGVT
jgi:hypothetical protein